MLSALEREEITLSLALLRHAQLTNPYIRPCMQRPAQLVSERDIYNGASLVGRNLAKERGRPPAFGRLSRDSQYVSASKLAPSCSTTDRPLRWPRAMILSRKQGRDQAAAVLQRDWITSPKPQLGGRAATVFFGSIAERQLAGGAVACRRCLLLPPTVPCSRRCPVLYHTGDRWGGVPPKPLPLLPPAVAAARFFHGPPTGAGHRIMPVPPSSWPCAGAQPVH